MRRAGLRARLLAAVALAALAGPAAAEIGLTDDLGRRVTLPAPARRIATLAPSLTETAFAAGAGARVVGVSAWSDQPPEASRLPVVSSAAGIDLEALARLSPDLVVAWKDSFRASDIGRLEALGAKVYVAQSRTLSDIPRLLGAFATLSGTDAASSVRAWEARLAAVRARHAGRPRLRAFLEVSHRPLITVAGAHFLGEALEACGAVNVFADLAEVAPHVSWEELIGRDPDVIVGMGSSAAEAGFRRAWAGRQGLAAVRHGRVAYVASYALGRPSPPILDGIDALCAALDRARQAGPDARPAIISPPPPRPNAP